MTDKDEKLRFKILGGIAAAVFLLFVYNLMLLQISEGESYRMQATKGYTATQSITAARGEIVDRYGRPFTTNRIGFDIIFDKAFFPDTGENEVILSLMELMDGLGQSWTDNLPIGSGLPFAFSEGQETEIARLKAFLKVAEYASAEECMSWLAERYDLGSYSAESGTYQLFNKNGSLAAEYTPYEVRRLAGVRYEMEQRSFSLRNTYTFAQDVGTVAATAVSERGYALPGVSVVQSTVREFVDGTLAPHIIGNTGPLYQSDMDKLKEEGKLYSSSNPTGYKGNETIGKSGIEKAFEDVLRGEDGTRTITMDAKGNVLSVEETDSPDPGDTVLLTLDKDLQRVAQDALQAQIAALNLTATVESGKYADAGAAVAVKVDTGEILAMATWPGYDNATYYQDYNMLAAQKPEPLLNRATMGTYRPGSTYKPSVAVAGLAEGVITPTELITCNHIYTRFSDYQPRCMHADGPITVVTALQRSCNIFFYETGWRLGISKMNEYSYKLGLGHKTGIEIGEAAGRLSSPETREAAGDQWTNGNVIQSAIGQLDHAFTPVQLASYTATLANNGERMQLHLVKSIRSYSFSETISETQPEVIDKIEADPEVFETVRQGMIAATGPAGTSYRYWVGFPLTVASKTGTPEAAGTNLDSCYICYMPAEDPEIAIAVVIEKGGQGYTGAPVARAIAEEYFYGSSGSNTLPAVGTLLQ